MKTQLLMFVILTVLASSTMFIVLSISNEVAAEKNCKTDGTVTACSGGGPHENGLGGSGGRFEMDSNSGEFTSSGGYSLGDGENYGGFHCEGIVNEEESTVCVGSEEFRN